jgi:hypothetical protein
MIMSMGDSVNGEGAENALVAEHTPIGAGEAVSEEEQRAFLDMDPRLLDPSGTHNKPFVFPGRDGLPYRGQAVPDLKEDDPLSVGGQVHVHVLVLSNEDDFKLYRAIWQAVGNGFAQISQEDRVYDEDIKNWRVFIRWVIWYTHTTAKG